MEDGLAFEEKLRRLQRLQARQEQITAARLKAWEGREVEVLLEGPSSADKKCLQGRTSQNIVLNLDREEPRIQAGAVVRAVVSEAGRHTLKGRFLGFV